LELYAKKIGIVSDRSTVTLDIAPKLDAADDSDVEFFLQVIFELS
jgi:plasmid maintenance system antidote protein VapI